MIEIAIRAPSIEALLDPWSTESLERRPLSDEARERIVERWTEVRKRSRSDPLLAVTLPASERQDGFEARIAAAVREDMRTMAVDARRHWIRRSLRPRETRIGIFIFFVALIIAGAIDIGASEGSVQILLGQTFVVIAWVALWDPAYRLFTAASFRLGRRYFDELAEAQISVRWE